MALQQNEFIKSLLPLFASRPITSLPTSNTENANKGMHILLIAEKRFGIKQIDRSQPVHKMVPVNPEGSEDVWNREGQKTYQSDKLKFPSKGVHIFAILYPHVMPIKTTAS